MFDIGLFDVIYLCVNLFILYILVTVSYDILGIVCIKLLCVSKCMYVICMYDVCHDNQIPCTAVFVNWQ